MSLTFGAWLPILLCRVVADSPAPSIAVAAPVEDARVAIAVGAQLCTNTVVAGSASAGSLSQTLFACRTCEAATQAAVLVCASCRQVCHAGHELVPQGVASALCGCATLQSVRHAVVAQCLAGVPAAEREQLSAMRLEQVRMAPEKKERKQHSLR